MIGKLGTVAAFLSALFFPWPLTACLALSVSITEPLVPFAVGLFVDTLHYSSGAAKIPLFTIWGALVTILAFFVRSRLKTSIIEG